MGNNTTEEERGIWPSASVNMGFCLLVPLHHVALSPQRGPQHYITLFLYVTGGPHVHNFSAPMHTLGMAANGEATLFVTR